MTQLARLDLTLLGANTAARWAARPPGEPPGDLLLPPAPLDEEGNPVEVWTLVAIIDANGSLPGDHVGPVDTGDADALRLCACEMMLSGVVRTLRVWPKDGEGGTYAELVTDVNVLQAWNDAYRVAEDPGYHGADPAQWPAWVR